MFILKAESFEPSPVYLFAHGNGGTANLNAGELGQFVIAGYSVISWESVTKLDGASFAEDLATCKADLELVFAWFKENAAVYNFDPNAVVIGGRSRGSICSWDMTHSGKPEIQGLYMYNALPDGVWTGTNDPWLLAITAEKSPPAYLVFGPECPRPITQDCVPSPDPRDRHSPRNGQKIVERYTQLSLKINLTDGLENNNIGVFDLFPYFAASLAGTTALTTTTAPPAPVSCSNNFSELCTNQEFPKLCGECVTSNQAALAGAGCTEIALISICSAVGATTTTSPPSSTSPTRDASMDSGIVANTALGFAVGVGNLAFLIC